MACSTFPMSAPTAIARFLSAPVFICSSSAVALAPWARSHQRRRTRAAPRAAGTAPWPSSACLGDLPDEECPGPRPGQEALTSYARIPSSVTVVLRMHPLRPGPSRRTAKDAAPRRSRPLRKEGTLTGGAVHFRTAPDRKRSFPAAPSRGTWAWASQRPGRRWASRRPQRHRPWPGPWPQARRTVSACPPGGASSRPAAPRSARRTACRPRRSRRRRRRRRRRPRAASPPAPPTGARPWSRACRRRTRCAPRRPRRPRPPR